MQGLSGEYRGPIVSDHRRFSVSSYNIPGRSPYNAEFMKNFLFVLVLSTYLAAPSAPAAEKKPLFQDDTVIKAVLTAPIAQAYAQREQDVRIYIPGYFSYADESGDSRRLDVSIRTRGLFRREYCALPPLLLNFKKKQLKETVFDGQDKLKVVAPCQDGPFAQQLVVLEYLAYKTFEILTEQSYGTRLMRLSYVDTDEKREPWTDVVFVIEDDKDMAKRLGLVRLGVVENDFDQIDRPYTALVDLFQMLISNYDYSVLQGPEGRDCCHNTTILAPKHDADTRFAVPFDFDMSGLVNARYAAPPSHIPIRFVRTRYYRGLCHPPGVLEDAVDHVRSKREQIMALFENTRELEAKKKRKTLAWLEDYFDTLEDPDRLDKEIISRCRGREELEEMLASEEESREKAERDKKRRKKDD